MSKDNNFVPPIIYFLFVFYDKLVLPLLLCIIFPSQDMTTWPIFTVTSFLPNIYLFINHYVRIFFFNFYFEELNLVSAVFGWWEIVCKERKIVCLGWEFIDEMALAISKNQWKRLTRKKSSTQRSFYPSGLSNRVEKEHHLFIYLFYLNAYSWPTVALTNIFP